MTNHVKIYMDHFGYGDQDMIPSEVTGLRATDIHHLKFRSHGGKDEIDNLMALTREEHEKAHNDCMYNLELIHLHKQFLDGKDIFN